MGQRFEAIDSRSAAARLDRYRVVDVREADEFHGPLGHVVGADLLPLSRVAENVDQLGKGPLLVVCRSGRRSGVACETLIDLGVTNVVNLVGGMVAWNEAGLPVEGRDSA